MAAARYNFEVPVNGTWRKTLRLTEPAGSRLLVSKRKPLNLTGYHAKMQVRARLTSPDPLLTLSTRLTDSPDGLIEPLDSTGVIRWTVDLTDRTFPSNAVYDLLVYDLDGFPDPILEGQIFFVAGVTVP